MQDRPRTISVVQGRAGENSLNEIERPLNRVLPSTDFVSHPKLLHMPQLLVAGGHVYFFSQISKINKIYNLARGDQTCACNHMVVMSVNVRLCL